MSTNLNHETKDPISRLLELAAKNDLQHFKQIVDHEAPSIINRVGACLAPKRGSNEIILSLRSPLMVAATYGSIDVVKEIISSPLVIVNRWCWPDCSTPLHYAASGGSKHAIRIVKMLLAAGANPNFVNAHGDRPIDVIVVPQDFEESKHALELLLSTMQATKSRQYPYDRLPNINNGLYATDGFRMFFFKVRPCYGVAFPHEWRECPYAHPGEPCQRRDPVKYHYSYVPCKDLQELGACPRGDSCGYAHGVFESLLHPTQYRTRLCKHRTSCSRKVCSLAHTQEELRAARSSNIHSPALNQLQLQHQSMLPPRNAGHSLPTSVAPVWRTSNDRAAMIARLPSTHLSSCDLGSNAVNESCDPEKCLPSDPFGLSDGEDHPDESPQD